MLPIVEGKRVLVIGEGCMCQTILVDRLHQWGLQSYVIDDIAYLVPSLQQDSSFDVVIMDRYVRDQGDLTVIDTIRAVTDTLPIILYTTLAMRKTLDTLVENRGVILLHKPIKPKVLLETLVSIVQHGELHDAAHAVASHRPPIQVPTWAEMQSSKQKTATLLAHTLPLRILIVEDNQVNQKVALRMLERIGYSADVVENGEEALRVVEQTVYDVVFMDIQMPHMDGLEATRLIRQRVPHSRQPRIIAMTAHALQGDRRQCIEAGMDDYVSKPIQLEQLYAVLEHIRPVSLLVEESVGLKPHTPPPPAAVACTNVGESAPSQIAIVEREQKKDEDEVVVDSTVLHHLQESLGGDDAKKVIDELIMIFVRDTRTLLDTLDEAIAHEDRETWTRLAHTLKSSSAQMGAKRLSLLCKELEQAGRKGTNYETVPTLVHSIRALSERVCQTLSTLEK
jgi:CheY-like chemotaxis protein